MRIVFVHNYYQQSGGEDAVFNAESALLEENGHYVTRYTASNHDVSFNSTIKLAALTIWNNSHYRKLREIFHKIKPDIVHVHNTLPLISPSIYFAAYHENVPLVQMMHNYRPFCLNGVLYRNGRICEDCINRYPIPGILHKCYRNSYTASFGVFSLYLTYYKILKTYQKHIPAFIVSTYFTKRLFVRMGLDENKISVKPNLVKVPPYFDKDLFSNSRNMKIIYVGRLDSRKGIWTLLSAIEQVNIPLTLVGDGDLRSEIEKWSTDRPNLKVEITGWLDSNQISERLRTAYMLILPSEFYESFGNVIVEAFGHGVPVITTNIGAQSELVQDGVTGFLFPPGDVHALVQIIKTLTADPILFKKLSVNTRHEFEAKYTPERNYEMLMKIYSDVINLRH